MDKERKIKGYNYIKEPTRFSPLDHQERDKIKRAYNRLKHLSEQVIISDLVN